MRDTASKAVVNFASRSRIRWVNRWPALLEFGGEIAGELGGPLASGMSRDAEQVHPPGPDLDDERDVEALERDRAVDVEEVRGQQRGGVGAQEGPPGLVAVRWRRDMVSAQDLADGGGRDPVPEAAQLSLGCVLLPSAGSPAPAARSARRVRLGSADVPVTWAGATLPRPCGGASAAACPGSRSAVPRLFRHDSGERGEHGTVSPGQARPRIRPAQYRDLVPQREYLRVLGRRGPGQQSELGKYGHHQPVYQRDEHGRRSCGHRSPRSNPEA